MKTNQLTRRILAIILCFSLLLPSVPTFARAADFGTIAGEEQTVSVSTANNTSRASNFNEGWKFYLGTSNTAQNPNFNDSGWTSVTLPHDFSIFQDFTTSGEAESGFLPGGTGWYRKSFTLPSDYSGKTVVLDFDGVYSSATVYVNGTQVGENHYGYTSFAFDITDYIVCDGVTENVIAVKAVNQLPTSRWYSGSGIYRNVTLIITEPVHVAYNGTYITTPNISSGNGTVKIQTEVANDSSKSVNVTVRQTIYNASDEQVAVAQASGSVKAGETSTITVSPVVSKPKLWSPDSPVLYYARTELLVDGVVTDTYDTTFGFRYFSFDRNTGFYLNGQMLKINGVCLHHDQGALGSAAHYDAIYRQLSIMKEMGVNAVRTSHNPSDKQFIQICNEIGLLVMEEAFDGWDYAKDSNTYDFSRYFNTKLSADNHLIDGNSSMTWAEFAIKSMVKRDRNDPAVFMWSIGNEVGQSTSANGSTFASTATKLINWIKELDTTRQTTLGSNQRTSSGYYGSLHSAVVNAGGIAGFNYANVYGGSEYSSLHNAYGALIGTETASAINSRGIYCSQANGSDADGKYHLTSYDTSKVGWGMTAHEALYTTYSYDYVAGQFVWTGFDYIGEPTPWNGTGTGSITGSGAIPNSSYFGIVDTAGFPKDSYYLYRSQWNRTSTTLHLVTAWDSDNMVTSSGKTPVVIYSNAPTVKLYRDNTLIGTATRKTVTTSAGHTYYTYSVTSNNTSICTASNGSGSTSLYATFNVAYTKGTLRAVAYDANGNVINDTVGKSSVSTPGTAAKLVATQSKTQIAADGSSLVYIEVDVQDANGNFDTTADNTIYFNLSGNGTILGVDNGDQATTEKFQQSSVLTSPTSAHIKAFSGKALVIVQSTTEAGGFTVNISSNNLAGTTVKVDTTEVENGSIAEGLMSYTMVRDYSVTVGTVPTLKTTAIGTLANGSTISGHIAWDVIPESVYSTPGDYTINGLLTFAGEEPLPVTARLHVIDRIVALRNISAVTTTNTVPELPSTVFGIRADGSLSGEFAVTWDTMSANQFRQVGDIVVVNGTATIIGDATLNVTASVRVAEAVNTESINIAPNASSLTQSVPSNMQSDVLTSIIDGKEKPGNSPSDRWTNYNYRTTSANASLTFSWATAELVSGVNLYYYYDSCCAYPSNILFEYSLNGSTFYTIEATPELVETYSFDQWASGALYSYTFKNVINPIALRITFTQQNGTSGTNCVGLNEAEIMTFAGSVEVNSSSSLSAITVDGTALDGFRASTYDYEAEGEIVQAKTTVNAGITILPELDNVVRVLTVSEDNSSTSTYTITLTKTTCAHTNTELRNATAATCSAAGYTGDVYCADCDTLITPGEAIPAVAHTPKIVNDREPTCTVTGYTGDTYCADCGTLITPGEVIPTVAHTPKIVNDREPTCTVTGYTGDTYCADCGTLITPGEVIPTVAHTPKIVNDREPTCTVTGFTGDTVCADCGKKLASGVSIAAKGHSWDKGVVAKEATEQEEGIKLFSCMGCTETYTESIPRVNFVLDKPVMSVSASRASGNKLKFTGNVSNFEYFEENTEIVEFGIVYVNATKLGTKDLTINTAGRTKVTFKSHTSDGSFSYSISPSSNATKYAVRAYFAYKDENGKIVYKYSSIIRVSYNSST